MPRSRFHVQFDFAADFFQRVTMSQAVKIRAKKISNDAQVPFYQMTQSVDGWFDTYFVVTAIKYSQGSLEIQGHFSDHKSRVPRTDVPQLKGNVNTAEIAEMVTVDR